MIRGKTFIRVAVGDQDNLQVRDKAFHELLTELKIEHEWELVPGYRTMAPLFMANWATGPSYYQKA